MTNPKKPSTRKIPWLGIAFVVIALALVGAIVFSSDSPIGSEGGEPEVAGEALPAFVGTSSTDPEVDPAVGTAAPVVDGADFEGTAVELADGNPQAIVFLAHWCPHCQAEVPRVQDWLDSGGGVDGVEMVSVATSMDSTRTNYPPSEWLDNEGWSVPVIADSEPEADVYVSYGAGGFPYWVFVDADGNVVRRSSGELDISTLESYMQEIAPAA